MKAISLDVGGRRAKTSLSKLYITLVLYLTPVFYIMELARLPPWMLERLEPSLSPYVREVSEALLMTFILTFAASSVIAGICLDAVGHKRKLAFAGGVGLSLTSLYVGLTPILRLKTAVIMWVLLGVFSAFTLFPAFALIKAHVNSWSRGKLLGVSFAAGTALNLVPMHFASAGYPTLYFQSTLLLLIAILLGTRIEPRVIGYDSIHVRDFRLYLFMVPTFILALFLGHFMKAFIISGYAYVTLSTFTHSPILTLPVLLALIAGYIMDRWGRRECGAIGSLLLLAGVITLLAHNITGALLKSEAACIATFSFIEAGIAFIIPYLLIVWSDVPRKEVFGRIFALETLVFSVGFVSGALVTTFFCSVSLELGIITLALVPITYVILKLPETLSRERLLRDELRRYMRKAMEIAGKARD